MTNLLKSWAINKAVGKINVGQNEEDPYFETIPHKELSFFQKEGSRRKKALPPGLSKNDQKVLKRVKSRAYHLDLAFQCCCGIQVGWAGLIGIIPLIGDIITVLFALRLVQKAKTIDGGLPAYIYIQMMTNVAFDFGFGLIPLVGDLINIAYKANTRNFILLENHLKAKVDREHGVEKHEGFFGRFQHHQNPETAQQSLDNFEDTSTSPLSHGKSKSTHTNQAPVKHDIGSFEPPFQSQYAGKDQR